MLRRESLARLRSPARLVALLASGAVAALLTGIFGSWRFAGLVGWDASAFTFVVIVWIAISRMDGKSTASHALREDPGRAVTDVVVLVAAIASLGAVAVELAQSRNVSHTEASMVAALGLLSVALSWFSVHTLFMLRYARMYYGDEPGGIDFNQDIQPRYLDFAYLAFTVGMTFQISDTNISSSPIRAVVLRHALLSYLFGAVILAVAINLVVGIATTA